MRFTPNEFQNLIRNLSFAVMLLGGLMLFVKQFRTAGPTKIPMAAGIFITGLVMLVVALLLPVIPCWCNT